MLLQREWHVQMSRLFLTTVKLSRSVINNGNYRDPCLQVLQKYICIFFPCDPQSFKDNECAYRAEIDDKFTDSGIEEKFTIQVNCALFGVSLKHLENTFL